MSCTTGTAVTVTLQGAGGAVWIGEGLASYCYADDGKLLDWTHPCLGRLFQDTANTSFSYMPWLTGFPYMFSVFICCQLIQSIQKRWNRSGSITQQQLQDFIECCCRLSGWQEQEGSLLQGLPQKSLTQLQATMSLARLKKRPDQSGLWFWAVKTKLDILGVCTLVWSKACT